MKRLAWTVCAAVLLASGACGNDSVDLDDLPDEVDDAVCDWLVRCGAIGSRDDCPRIIEGDLDPDIAAGVDNGTIDYDGEKAADCLDSISGGSCNVDDHDGGELFGDSSCDDVYTGTVDDGGECYIDAQCESANCVEDPGCVMECCIGTCQPGVPDAELGEACGFVGDEFVSCADDLYCDGEACAPLLAEGTPCDSDGQCDRGLSCYGLGDDPETCQPLPGEGEPCEGQGIFEGSGCNSPGLTCDPATRTCEPWLHEGDACGPDSSRCSPFYLRCDPETNTCQPFPDVGEPCEFQCRDGAYCDFATSTCAAQKGDGESCANDNECLSDFCDGIAGQCASEDETSCISP